jgi:hypothetical protein
MGGKVYFREAQRFRQKWLWALMLVVVAPFAYGVVRQLVLREPWGARPLPDAGLVGILLLLLAACAWLYSARLVTEVSDAGIMTHFKGLWRRRLIPFAEIRNHESVTYNPIADYGGWGIRYGFGGGKAYNVSGDRGVQLELSDGGRLLIGSQRPDELDRAITDATRGEQSRRGAGEWMAN